MNNEWQPFSPDQATPQNLTDSRRTLGEILKNNPDALPSQYMAFQGLCRDVFMNIGTLITSYGSAEIIGTNMRVGNYTLLPKEVKSHEHLYRGRMPPELNQRLYIFAKRDQDNIEIWLQKTFKESSGEYFFKIYGPGSSKHEEPDFYLARLGLSSESFAGNTTGSDFVTLSNPADRRTYLRLLQIATCELLHTLPEPYSDNVMKKFGFE